MDNNQIILDVYLQDSYGEHHIRELARKTGLHPNTVITATDELEKSGLLQK